MKSIDLTLEIQQGTKQFAMDVLSFCGSVHENSLTKPLLAQLVQSASGIGANYRSAKRAGSKEEFIKKIKLVEEGLDEALFFLEIFLFLLPEQEAVIVDMDREGNELLGALESTLDNLD